jgi:hypothetical protein
MHKDLEKSHNDNKIYIVHFNIRFPVKCMYNHMMKDEQ